MIPKNHVFVKKNIIYGGSKVFLIAKNYLNLPNMIWVDFYVLVCRSANFGPILDFKVSADSYVPKDFKSGLKKVN